MIIYQNNGIAWAGRIIVQGEHFNQHYRISAFRALPLYILQQVKTYTDDAHVERMILRGIVTISPKRLSFCTSPLCAIPFMSTLCVETNIFKNPASALASPLSENCRDFSSTPYPMASSPAFPVVESRRGSGPLVNCLLSGRYHFWKYSQSIIARRSVDRPSLPKSQNGLDRSRTRKERGRTLYCYTV